MQDDMYTYFCFQTLIWMKLDHIETQIYKVLNVFHLLDLGFNHIAIRCIGILHNHIHVHVIIKNRCIIKDRHSLDYKHFHELPKIYLAQN